MASARHATGMRRRTAAGSIADSKAEAVAQLILEVAQCFFRIRALGQKTGLITSWGGGAFGFIRSLALLGPLTVPQIAQMRPTSRQRMQRLADELAAEGLVEFVDNPRHQRSKLVRLTPKGTRAIASSTPGCWRSHRAWAPLLARRMSARAPGSCGS